MINKIKLKSELLAMLSKNTDALDKVYCLTSGTEAELYRSYLVGRRVAILECIGTVDMMPEVEID